MKEKRTAAVVVTYNRRELLKNCIACLLSQRSAACDVLVVDNASSDGTGDVVRSLTDARVFYRNTGANLGGAGGFNFGMRWAVESGYDLVWVMDDDCLPKPDALQKLLAADKILAGKYGFLSSVVLWTDGGECRMNRQKIRKKYYERAELLKYGLIEVEQATFVSLLFPSEVIRRAGLPVREFFIWGDDIEYTRRLTVRLKLPCFMVTASEVIHAMKENNGSSIATDAPERLERYRYAFRNEAYLYRQEGPKGICYYLAKCGLNVWRIISQANTCRLTRLRIIFSAMLQGIFFNPKTEMVCGENKF